jgi:hypothetical protein
MNSLWLTEKELVELTDKKHRKKQIEVLASMRVKFRVRPQDSFPLVDRWQFLGADDKKRFG